MHAVKPRAAPAELSQQDYIRRQEASGHIGQDALFPERDPRVLRLYHELVTDYDPSYADGYIRLYMDKYGFWIDPIDAERPGRNWAMSTPVIDMGIAAGFQDFYHDLPSLKAEIAADGISVLTDSFSFLDGYGDLKNPVSNIIRLYSPAANIQMDFSTYLESLTSERRKKYRRMHSDFQPTGLRFELSDVPLDNNELSFILRNLEKKWGDEAGYAYRQTLWTVAVQRLRPAQHLTMRVYDRDLLVFVQTMIVKGNHVYCQSIAKNEDHFYSGLAAYTDFQCIENLCSKSQYKIFDPSCRTSLEDPESIGIAKRATVNQSFVKPILAIGSFDADIAAIIASPVIQGKDV